VCTVGLVRGQ